MRIILSRIFALLACLSLVVCSPLSSAIFSSAQAHADEVDNKRIKVGVFEFDGYHMQDEDGNYTGYGIELLELIERYSHLNFELIGFEKSWQEMLEMLDNGEIDMVTSARYTPERAEKYLFSLPLGMNNTILSVDLDNTSVIGGDYSTYDGMRIGIIPGSSQNAKLEAFSQEKGFSYEPIAFEDTDELAKALQEGQVDAILSSDLRKSRDEKTLETIDKSNFYAIVRADEPGLIEEIDYAIEQIDLHEGDWRNVLYYRFYGPEFSSATEFTDREREFIEQVQSGQKTITATAITNRRPYSYEEDGKLKGILIDYFATVMEVADLPFEIVVPSSPDDYMDLASNNGVDVVIDGMVDDYKSTNKAQESNGFTTDPYMEAGYANITRADSSRNLEKIAVVSSQAEAISNLYAGEDVEVIIYSSTEEAMNAVKQGEVDAAYVYSYSAQLFMNREQDSSLNVGFLHDLDVDFAMYVRNTCDHELVTILDKCIQKVPRSKLDQLISEYTSYSLEDLSFGEFVRANPGAAWLAGFIIVAGIALIFALYVRDRVNKRLLRAEEESNKVLGEQFAIVDTLSRDYTNIFAIDAENATFKVLKLEGFVTDGIDKDYDKEYDFDPILRRYVNDRVHPDDQEDMRDSLSLDKIKETLANEMEHSGTYRIINRQGEVHHFQYVFTFLKGSDDDRLILGGFRNIDETIKNEQQQKEILSEALSQAQYANKAKTTFLNNMSHDIRTPMNAIIGFTSLASSNVDNAEQVQSYLRKIMTSSNHLLSLINDVLDMSRIESGKVNIEEKETSLPDVMHDLKTIVQTDIKSKQLEFFIDTLDIQNETIICDKLRLNQVLLNILSNAMKYTNPGGMVSVRVLQTTEEQNGYADYEFRVKDTGIGMSEEFLDHVFEPFERERTATVSGIQGTGLGLAITKNIVDIMGGTIEVVSEVGVGSEFVVRFRFRVADSEQRPQEVKELVNLRALVVDDDIDTCMSVSKMLTIIGMRPDWTTLGKEAVVRTEFALEQNNPYSVYIVDWLMPDMNGIETVRRIRKIVGDLAPIIILTAYDWTDIEAEAREAGVTAFCSKPLFLSELRDVLTAPFEEKEQEAEEPEEISFDGKRILLVEDNELNSEIAQAILEKVGFEVDTVEDGAIAVERIEEVPADTYDLILSDVQMPIMDGYELTRVIRAMEDPAKASIPIVAMTANAFDEDREEAMAAGMSGYVFKPINVKNLMSVLSDLLKERQ